MLDPLEKLELQGMLVRLALMVLGALGPMLPRAWRINPASEIAKALVEAALAPQPGEHVVASSALAG